MSIARRAALSTLRRSHASQCPSWGDSFFGSQDQHGATLCGSLDMRGHFPRWTNARCVQSRFSSSSSAPDAYAVPFNVTYEEAQEAQKRHHTRHFFQAVPPAPYKAKDAFLPFWAFTVTVDTYVHSVDVTVDRVVMGPDRKLKTVSSTRNIWIGQRLPPATYSDTDEDMQVPAVKKYFASDLRRMRAGAQLTSARRVSGPMLDSEICGTRRVGAFEVSARDALPTAQRALRSREETRAEGFAARWVSPWEGLNSRMSINLDMQIVAVKQRPFYVPAYIFSHRYEVSGVTTKLRTFVSGFDPGRVSGTQVLDPVKVAAAAGVAVGATALALGSAGSLWELGLLYGALPAVASGYAALYWPVALDLWQRRVTKWQEQLQEMLARAALNQQHRQRQQFGTGGGSWRGQQRRQQQRQQQEAPAGSRGDSRGFYTALGVERDASTDEIKAAFRGLALKFHPDRVTDAKEKEKMSAKFKVISEAYQILRNPQRRALYDSTGSVE